MCYFVGESEGAHPSFWETSTIFPWVANGKPDAAVFKPSAVTLVVVLETPGGVKLADQRQLGSLVFAGVYSLLKGEGPRYVEDRACDTRRDQFINFQSSYTQVHYWCNLQQSHCQSEKNSEL